MIKELGAKEHIALDCNKIHNQMKSLFEKYLHGNIDYNTYQVNCKFSLNGYSSEISTFISKE